MPRRLLFILLLAALLVPTLLSGCASGGSAKSEMKLAPLSEMPEEVRIASKTTQQAYQFAVANPDLMKEIPCYCGCGSMGHASNYACYVKSDEGGTIVFDQHALGCSICVDITLDAMRLSGEGKSPAEIKAYVDQTYSQYGPSNIVE